MQKTLAWHAALISAICFLILFVNLGTPRLWDRDEPRNAGCAEEMMARGDWITPIFNDELRQQKPVLLYWFMMSAYAVFGANEFSARIWSAIFATGTVWMTYLMANRFFGRQAALWSAIALCSSMMFVVAGRAATPDSILIFFTTLAICIWVCSVFKADAEDPEVSSGKVDYGSYFPKSWLVSVGIYGAMGMAVLAKGPIGLVLPTAIIGLFLLIVRLPKLEGFEDYGEISQKIVNVTRPFWPLHFLRTCWSMRPLTAVAMVLLVAGPWYLAVGIATEGDFLRLFFLKENFGRATTAMESHSGGFLFYPMMILVGFFPWSVLALPIGLRIDRVFSNSDESQRTKNGILFCLCWIAVFVGAFSLAKTKLPSYITPCYPALAMLAGFFVQGWLARRNELSAILYRMSIGTLILVGAVITIGIPIATEKYIGGEQWLVVVGLVLVVGGIVMLILDYQGKRKAVVATMGGASVSFTFLLMVIAASTVGRYQTSSHIFAAFNDCRTEDSQLGTFGCMESTWVYYSKAPVLELYADGEEREWSKRVKDWKPKPRTDVLTFVKRSPDPYLITTDTRIEELQLAIGKVKVVAETDYFLQEDEKLLLVKPIPEQVAMKSSASSASQQRR